jgi:4-hydroxybenzoate polyprenyltransferase
MAVSRGFIPILLIWSIGPDSISGINYAILAFIWVMGYQGTKDINDVDGDKKYGIKTIISYYGLNGLRFLMVICLICYFLLCLLFKLHIMLGVVPIGIFTIYFFEKKSNLTENTYGWMGFYIGLGLIFILMLFR